MLDMYAEPGALNVLPSADSHAHVCYIQPAGTLAVA